MKYLLLSFFFCTLTQISGQTSAEHWATLAMVDKESKFDDLLGMIVEKATPQEIAKTLDGKEIEINGFIIALAAKTELSHFMFSKFPQNMCFFCGAAGAESAMQVFMKKGLKVDFTSDKVSLKGTLNIQVGDPSGLIYTLSNAEFLKVIKS